MQIPKYVKIIPKTNARQNACCLRLIGEIYYRDAGEWSVGFKVINNVLFSRSDIATMPQLNDCVLLKCSKKEYEKDNAGYC